MAFFLFLNSKDSISSSTENYSFLLSGISNLSNQMFNISIDSVSIPNTRYTVHSLNKYLYVYENGLPGITKVSLTEGYYDSAAFIIMLQTQLNATLTNVYTITYSTLTKKITIQVPILNSFSFVDSSSNDDFMNELGLNSMTTFEHTQICESQLNLSGPQFCNLRSSFSTRNCKSGNGFNILYQFPMEVPLGSVQYWTNQTDDAISISSTDLNLIEFWIYDDYDKFFYLDPKMNINFILKLTPL